MTSDFTEMEQRRYFSTAARLANREPISAMEERWLRGYLDRNAPAREVEKGFPEAPRGDARGDNNLRRTNWFNGRYLTAEALSRQDVYFDHRARLNAHALMPGIAWGLGIVGVGLNQLSGNTLRGGCPIDAPLTLRRGLAFDGVGRPILVSQDFRFTLADLIGVALKTPRRVVGGGREFTPCVCLAPDTNGPSGGGGALPSGPFLLVIEAGERPEGKAKVTGDVCGGRHAAPCEADVWRGGFGLSLVRFPVDVPLLDAIPDVWALRGTLSAYYFDVFEHPLWRRWDPSFPIDGGFSRDSGPGRHEGMAIPLALVHLGEDNTALYLDSWIPRRLITATPGEDWHRVRFGAPPRAAAWARIHQFQTMLEESLGVRPLASTGADLNNLHGRGFRHIPPIGFLPVLPKALAVADEPDRQLEEACTRFSELTTDQEADNPYRGVMASFAVPWPNNPNRSNRIIQNSGFLLDFDSPACIISLQEPAEEVTVVLNVITEAGSTSGTGTSVVARGGMGAGGTRPILGSEFVALANQLQTITLRASGIQQVEIANKYPTFIHRFCYRYYGASTPRAGLSRSSLMVGEALRQAEAYFKGTNVVPYGVVALHDDDILEDLHNVIDKDPLQLELRSTPDDQDPLRIWPKPNATSSERLQALGWAALLLGSQGALGVVQFLLLLGAVLRGQGLDIDALVNRRTEVVKLVVPLQGFSRQHPLLGAIPEDALRQAQAWGLAGAAHLSTASLAGLLQERGMEVVPRFHVVYVKQRLVLLDLVFQMLELLQKLVELVLAATSPKFAGPATTGTWTYLAAASPQTQASFLTGASSNDYKAAFEAQSANDQQMIRATLGQAVVRELLSKTLATAAPVLANAERSQAFLDQVLTTSREQPATVSDPQERQALALAQVADAWAAEYPDAQVLQLLAAVQSPEQTLDLVKQLGATPGLAAGATVADGLKITPPRAFASEVSRELYAETRQRLERRPVRELLPDLPQKQVLDALTVADVLARTPQEARDLLGGTANLQKLRAAFLNDRKAALEAAAGLADGAPREVVAKVEDAMAKGVQADETLSRLKAEEAAKPERERDPELLRQITNAETLLRVGGNRLEVLRPLRRPPGA